MKMEGMGKQMLSRREINGLCAALGSSLPAASAIIATLSSASALATAAALDNPRRTVKFPDDIIVPALGQGSARLGQGRHSEAAEEEALRTGLSLGMTLIDTAEIRSARKIRAWGGSNFKVSHMEDLFHIPDGDRCATNQVPYNLGDRGIEHDLLPWCEQHDMPLMAYSPLGGPDSRLLRDPALARIGAAHDCSAAAVALAWTIRSAKVIAIPESGSVAHVKENAAALSLMLTPQELATLDAAYPP
jgi:diketogulonate reductase-like aldo/keto reductase